MFRKNILHKEMKRYIHNPRILLIGTSLEYSKIKYKVESLECIRDQQKE